jgi:alkylation response protein AidB-like acyl-CoA dehydrogenase
MNSDSTIEADDAKGALSSRDLREDIRRVIASARDSSFGSPDAWMRGHAPAFSARLAQSGFIGMTWPREYGGRGALNTERLVVTEELLRAGAPVAAHWMSDRQIGPAILRYGSPELQRRYLPAITEGRISFCLGMSETESGSDLAAVRTRAVHDGTVFRITGRKIWTSHAHRSTHAYVLARTGDGAQKHEGLTEFIVDLSLPGVSTRPILDLGGEHHFNETIFDDVQIDETDVIGEVGNGWEQVTDQLAFERGGLERVLSTYPVLSACLEPQNQSRPRFAELGGLLARLAALRSLAFEIAQSVDAGEAPKQAAAILKYLGTGFERDVVEHARFALAVAPDQGGSEVQRLLASGILAVPGATIRGGTTEVLLTIISKGTDGGDTVPDDLASMLDSALVDAQSAKDEQDQWNAITALGLPGIGSDEERGGSGGDFSDLVTVARKLGEHPLSVPVVASAIANRALTAAGRDIDPDRVRTVSLGSRLSVARAAGGIRVTGTLDRVPWSAAPPEVVVAAGMLDEDLVLLAIPLDSPNVQLRPGSNLAGEPRWAVVLDGSALEESAIIGKAQAVVVAQNEVVMLNAAALLGAMGKAIRLAVKHSRDREQFGRPIGAFQAVGHAIAAMYAAHTIARVALKRAVSGSAADPWNSLAAKILAADAATLVAKNAHQLLGAMGITQEHPLHASTLRIWAWRDEAIAEDEAAEWLGVEASRVGESRYWQWLTGERPSVAADPTIFDRDGRS